MGADEYLERLEGKLESAYSFTLEYSKITVWQSCQLNLNKTVGAFWLFITSIKQTGFPYIFGPSAGSAWSYNLIAYKFMCSGSMVDLPSFNVVSLKNAYQQI